MRNHIGIVGAGVIGRLLALRFASQGQKVTLFDNNPDGVGGASSVAAGMLSPYCELESSDLLIHHLGVESLILWPDLIDTLEDPVLFSKLGTLVVAHSRDLAELTRLRKRVVSFIGELGFRDVSSPEVLSLEPDLSERFMNGIFFPFEGSIYPQDFFFSTTRMFEAMKVECQFGKEVKLRKSGKISVDSQIFSFDTVVDCRGMGATKDLTSLRAVRGELMLVRAPQVHFKRPIRMMHPRYPLYVVPRPNRCYLIGATQIESDSIEAISVQSTLELLSAAFSLNSSFSEARVLSTTVGLRPTLPDHRPGIFIEDQLIRVNGLYRHGFLIGPKFSEIICDYVFNGTVPHEYSELFHIKQAGSKKEVASEVVH